MTLSPEPSAAPRSGSVIIPAHQEARVIGRLLHGITDRQTSRHLEIVVVCNGCTDATATVARGVEGVLVVELQAASKHAAIIEGERLVTRFPRAYLDADVEIDGSDLSLLMDVVEHSDVLAVGPERCMDVSRSSWAVRAFYRIWEHLPAVTGLQGRGVIVVSEAGHDRIRDWPELMADDLFVSTRFGPAERRVVREALVTVHGPLTTRDLVRRRVRAAQGNAELAAWDPSLAPTARQSMASLVAAYARQPNRWPDLLAFLTITCVARASSALRRRKLEGVWLRDESSRS